MVSQSLEKTEFPREINGIKSVVISEDASRDNKRNPRKTLKWPYEAITRNQYVILTTDTTMKMRIMEGLDRYEEKDDCVEMHFKEHAKFSVSAKSLLSVFGDGRFVGAYKTFLYDWKSATVRLYFGASKRQTRKRKRSRKKGYLLIPSVAKLILPVLPILTLIVIWLAYDKFVINPLLSIALVLGTLGIYNFIYFELKIWDFFKIKGRKYRQVR